MGEQWTIHVNGESESVDAERSRSRSRSRSWSWVSQVKKEVDNLTQIRLTEAMRWKKTSIYQIPWSLRNLHGSSAYEPQVVSIGPYHQMEPQLEGMEKHKRRAVLNLVARSGKPLHLYVDALALVVQELKDAYDQLDPTWSDEAFLKLMLHDGCFILELMRTTTTTTPDGYDCCDPVFSDHGSLYSVPLLKRDMLKLQNQIPLQVLKTILHVEAQGGRETQLPLLILKFLEVRKENIQQLVDSLHILDLYRRSLLRHLPSSPCREEVKLEAAPPEKPISLARRCRIKVEEVAKRMIRCRNKDDDHHYTLLTATELKEAGIKFKKSETRNLDDVAFSKKGVLQLPRTTVDDTSKSLYLNLMAFEQCHVDAGNSVTYYVYFMDKLIDSDKDVGLLQRRGIIDNALGSDQAVANLFNSLSTDACINGRSTLGMVERQVTDYCSLAVPLPRWKAYAKTTYFANPWVAISIVAAILLFALTILQTVFSILSYFQDKNSNPSN